MSSPVYYFDNNATTRVAPEVLEAMLPFLNENWGNPSSAYSFGHSLAGFIDEARSKVAVLLNAEPRELIFTSCGTESNNTAVHSALATQTEKRHLVTTAVEHSANIKFCNFLEKQGYEVTFLPVNSSRNILLCLTSRRWSSRERARRDGCVTVWAPTSIYPLAANCRSCCRVKKCLALSEFPPLTL